MIRVVVGAGRAKYTCMTEPVKSFLMSGEYQTLTEIHLIDARM